MVPDLFDVSGRRALVTGSTRGIGLALAVALARAGCAVTLHGRDRDTLDRGQTAASDYVNGQVIYVDGGMLATI